MKKLESLHKNLHWSMKRIVIVVTLLAMIVIPVSASSGTRTEAFVYAISAFDGQLFQSAFAPSTIDTLYLISGESSVIAPRQTMLYYWPITHRYEADWLAKNEFVEGVLEIKKGNTLVTSLDAQDYVIQYDSVDPEATRTLAIGADAQIAYDTFLTKRKEYQDQQNAYTQAFQAYTDEVSRIVSEAEGKTLTSSDFPPEPEKTASFTLFSTEVNQGFIIALDEGTYSMSFRLPDGTIQPGSEKKLVIFEKIQDGVAYKVIPSERWTDPDYSKEMDGVIYTPENTTIYLEPYLQSQYNEMAYQHMVDPQNTTSRADRNIWVSFETYPGGRLVVTQSGGAPQEKPIERYKVTQLKSSGLGYAIDVFDPQKDDQSSFAGYQLTVTNEQGEYKIYLQDTNGTILPGSNRQVRMLHTHQDGAMFAMSFLPLLVGFVAILIRRKSVRKIKVEE
jgi:hypothetical protein